MNLNATEWILTFCTHNRDAIFDSSCDIRCDYYDSNTIRFLCNNDGFCCHWRMACYYAVCTGSMFGEDSQGQIPKLDQVMVRGIRSTCGRFQGSFVYDRRIVIGFQLRANDRTFDTRNFFVWSLLTTLDLKPIVLSLHICFSCYQIIEH